MQELAHGLKYTTTWGAYHATLYTTARLTLVELHSAAPVNTLLFETTTATSEEAINVVAAWLEQQGCFALVDGRSRSLSDFLFFSASP